MNIYICNKLGPSRTLAAAGGGRGHVPVSTFVCFRERERAGTFLNETLAYNIVSSSRIFVFVHII